LRKKIEDKGRETPAENKFRGWPVAHTGAQL
jgi:hypothetical protein